jgi:eukaryotic-like serine/threonine-protein kinase
MAPGSNATGGERASDAPPRPSLDGRTSLGKYEIVRQLGAGGMGTVYLAVDSQLKRTVALKVLPKERAENETLVRRFQAEAQAAAQLKHENIVTVYDAGNTDGHLYIALELVEGTDIYELVARRGPLPLKRSVSIVKQVIHALDHLHKRGFVHRDIKPSNILVTRDGTVKLTDMGLARAVDESLKSNITREGTTVGTVDYMAPEQARDSQAADIRSDIYSLGCTWYQMLTAEPPYPTGSVTNKLYSHISKPRPDPRAVNRSVPEEVVVILHRMMARKPADRYQTPIEILEDIENLGAGNKRIAELLNSEGDNEPPLVPTPAYGSPLTLPPRHLPNRSPSPSRDPDQATNDPTPRRLQLPARRRPQSEAPTPPHSATPQTPPPQRLPARQTKNQTDVTPPPSRPAARREPGPSDASPPSGSRAPSAGHAPSAGDAPPAGHAPSASHAPPAGHTPSVSHATSASQTSSSNQTPSGSHTRRAKPVAEEPGSTARIVHDTSEAPVEDEPNRVSDRIETRERPSSGEHMAPVGRVATNEVPSNPKRIGASKRFTIERRPRATERVLNEAAVGSEERAAFDWKPLATKVAAVVGGVLVVGACAWFAISWRNSSSNGKNLNAANSPFAPVSSELPVDKEAEDVAAAKPPDEAGKAGASSKKTVTNPGVPVNFKKVGPDAKLPDFSLVLGRPEERENFPSWIADLWNPSATATSTGAAELKIMTVGRVDNDRANFPSLAAAIQGLPEQGGVIKLQGPGPFLLPPIKIANRRLVVITGAGAKSALSSTTPVAAESKPGPDEGNAPLIVLVPGSAGNSTDGGLGTSGTSLTLYGVHLVAFADQFPGDNPLRLIEAQSGDVIVQKCSVTLVGSRSGPTIGFSVSGPNADAGPDRSPRILFDRTLVRGKALTPLEADLRSVDLLAINSLFITGKSPVLSLTAGSDRSAPRSTGAGAARTFRIFSCTTCTDDNAVSMRLAKGSSAPATRFHIMNSVFGAVFQPQGLAMIALNDWPARPITTTNHVAFENLTWLTESFVARGWQSLVQSDTNPPLGTRDANGWGAYWGEPRSRVDDEPGSFTAVSDIAAADPARFRSDVIGSRPGNAGDSSLPGCDVSLLSAAATKAIARADVFAKRPKVPAPMTNMDADKGFVREIDLDNPNRKEFENLARFINHSDWKSGTRFRVRGTNKKICGPIHVTNRSLSIEFVDAPPPQLTFEVTKGDSRELPAFMSVAGGTLELINANFRVGSTAKHLPHWLLEVKNGSFTIRDSSLEGPSFERTGYQGLLHFTSSPATTARPDQPTFGAIINSFLKTGKTALSGELATRNVFIENSILASGGRLLDLQIPATTGPLPTLDLTGCTLAAGEEYFHLEANSTSQLPGRSTGHVRIIAEDTVFAPPLPSENKSIEKPVFIAGLPPDAIAGAVDWWEYACAYSNLIDMPKSDASRGRQNDPLAGWKHITGPERILRPAAGPNAALLLRDLPPAKDLAAGDFRLKPEAEAATWSDMGKPIGAMLAAHPASAPLSTPAVKAKPTGSHKTTPAKKAAPKPPQSGF